MNSLIVSSHTNCDISVISSLGVSINNCSCGSSTNGIYLEGGRNYSINNVAFSSITTWDINAISTSIYSLIISNYSSNKVGVTGINGLHTMIGDGHDCFTRLPFVSGIVNRDADIISGIAGIRAVGRLSFTNVATVADTFTINGQVHTFVTTVPTLPNTLRTSTSTAAVQASRVAAYFNSLSTERGNILAIYTSGNTYVDFRYRTPGIVGNTIGFAFSNAAVATVDGATLGFNIAGVDPIDNFKIDKLRYSNAL
jgi:hypothetical protein